MVYEESDVPLSADGDNGGELPPDILDEGEEAWQDELALGDVGDALTKKPKVPPVRFSLEKRRAIEDYLEERRLREEFDYEFDSEALENNDVTKSE